MKHPFRVLLALFLGLNSIFMLAQNKQTPSDFRISTTSQLQDSEYSKQIDALYESGPDGKFIGKEEIPIYWKIIRQKDKEKGAVLISSGRTEGALKYKEVIYDLYANGYSVYILDHRGQGLSGRMTEDPEMGYVEDFQYYIDDMKYFYDVYLVPGEHEKTFLLAHSLGGAIGMSYLEQYPNDFTAAAFSSPMLGFDWYVCPLAKILSGKTPKYAPGQAPFSDDYDKFDGNDVTGCKVRYDRKIDEYNKFPESRLGGVSVQWLNESCKQLKKVFKNIEDIETPILVFAADNETVVNPKSTEKFIGKAEKKAKDCSLIQIENAQHELLMEKDAQRSKVMTEIFQFYSEY